MIAASEPQEFVPYGRLQARRHPGAAVIASPLDTAAVQDISTDPGPPTVTSLNESWMLRGGANEEEEELYVSERTAVWSRGMAGRSLANSPSDLSAGRQLKSCYTMETPIRQALWCNFTKVSTNKEVPMPSVCLLDGTKINVFTTEGEDFLSALQFKVASAWPTEFGLLLERVTPRSSAAAAMTPPSSLECRRRTAPGRGTGVPPPNNNSTTNDNDDDLFFSPSSGAQHHHHHQLPIIFSLLHPLDEIAPVLVLKQGGSLAYLNDIYQKVVFTCQNPSLCMLCDIRSGQHTVWTIRRATPQESMTVCGGDDTASVTQTGGGTPHLLESSGGSSALYQRAAGNRTGTGLFHPPSPLLASRAGSSAASNKAAGADFKLIGQSPASMSASVSMSMSGLAGGVPTPTGGSRCSSRKATSSSSSAMMGTTLAQNHHHHHVGSPLVTDARLGTSQSVMGDLVQEPRPIVPELCFEFVWSENLALPCYHEGEPSPASRAFLSEDLLGRQYLCYVVPGRSRMFCVRLSWTANRQKIILGSVSTLPAKDAAYLPALRMTAVLEPSAGGVLLYTGQTLIGKLHVAGIDTALASSTYLSSSSAVIAQFSTSSMLMHSSSSPVHRRTSLLSSTAVGDAVFDDQVHLLSPVSVEGLPPMGGGDYGTPSAPAAGAGAVHSTPRDAHLRSVRDPVGNRLTLEFLNGAMFRMALPDVCSSPLVGRCLAVFKRVLPAEAALRFIVKWCGARNAPGTQDFSPLREWQLFVSLLLSLIGYDVERLPPVRADPPAPDSDLSQILRKKRASDCGSLDDWEYLLRSEYHESVGRDTASLLGLSPLANRPPVASPSPSTAHTGGASDEDGNNNNNKASCSSVTVKSGSVDTSAFLFGYAHLILFSLHLLYEDLKLDTLLGDTLPMLARLLHQLASDLRMRKYVEHYWRDFPRRCPLLVPSSAPAVNSVGAQEQASQISEDDLRLLSPPAFVDESPPDIMGHVYHFLQENDCRSIAPYPVISEVNRRSRDVVQLVGLLCTDADDGVGLGRLVKPVFPAGSGSGFQGAVSGSPHTTTPPLPPSSLDQLSPEKLLKANSYDCTERVVFLLGELGYTVSDLNTLPAGIGLVVCDAAIRRVRENPPTDWPAPAYRLIGRQDLAALSAAPPPPTSTAASPGSGSTPAGVVGGGGGGGQGQGPTPPPPAVSRSSQENDDGMETMDREVLKLRFSSDHRVAEVRNLLQSSQPVTIAIPQRPDVSDHEYIEEQEKHLYAICTRTMALPLGRGMLTLRTSCPVASEPLPVPRLCLSGRAPPRGTTVDLSHIEVVPNMNLWPLFHNGVAAGLRISPNASNIDSAWIVYNKPKGGPEVLPEHAGFLMALGLNGHLGSLAEQNTFKYLSRCHEMTSVGLLLGIAASNRGTMDVQTTKMLSVHIESLLPPTSIELDIVQNIQVAALLGVGLVYQKTAHRHVAEVLLSEIGRPPGPEMENSVDRESYSLAAGLALGLVVLGTGESTATGLADLGIADTLHYYMVGGHKRPLSGSQKEKYRSPSYQIREGDEVNIGVTAPGATLALGMMFFNSGNRAVANWMIAPDTQFLLDFVCPDQLLLRMIARGLILWDDIIPTEDWVKGHVPAAIRPYCLVKPHPGNLPDNVDYETMNQAYCNIIAGACMAMGLRFAGSANNEAFTTLLNYCKMFTSMFGKTIAELAGKSTIETCLNVILLALAMVMAGTGELQVMRLCRYLRSRVGQASNSVVTYGSHLATHMALGLLFMGGGRYTLGTSPEAVAAMLCAFFPKFPTHSNDNRYHLQALRHLYVLAAKPRILLPRDIDSGSLCYVHLTAVYLDTPHYTGQTARLKAPCLLPELHLLKEVRVEDERYWSVVFRREQNWDQLENILNGSGSLGVKQRAGCLSYLEDPHGFRSLLAQTLTTDKAVSWSVPAESIFSFSSEPSTVNFAHFFLEQSGKDAAAAAPESEQLQFLTKLVFECVTHDKMSILPIWLTVLKGIQTLISSPDSAGQLVWQLKLLIGYALKPPPTPPLPAPAAGGGGGHHGNTGVKAAAAEPLISPELALSVKQRVSALLDQWQSNDIGEALADYMKSGRVSASEECIAKLAMYITFHDIPSPQVMSQILAADGSIVNPIGVYLMLKHHQNSVQQNRYNHLALLFKKTSTD